MRRVSDAFILLWLFTTTAHQAVAYHLGDDTVHCWTSKVIGDCPTGFDLVWISRPPTNLVAQIQFNASYALILGSVVPAPGTLIAHANLHACPQDMGFCDVNTKNGTVAPSGEIVTQEAAQISTKSAVIVSKLRLPQGAWTIVAHQRVFYPSATNSSVQVQLDIARAVYRNVIKSSCSPGYVNVGLADDGSAQCAVCGVGTFSNEADSKSCTLCPPGQFQAELGKTGCQSCPPGYFQSMSGQSQCFPCPGFTYADPSGSKCNACPYGTWTAGGAPTSASCVCQQGFYDLGNSTCVACPKNGYCCSCDNDPLTSWTKLQSNIKNGKAPCDQCLNGSTSVIPMPGFYPSAELANRFYECDPPESCLGGPSLADSELCADGYEGDRCGKCSQGHYLSFSGACKKCEEPWRTGFLLTGFILVVLFLIFLTLVFVCSEDSTDAGAVLLMYFQVLDLIRRYKSVWPPYTAALLYGAGLFNIDLTFFRLDCYISLSQKAEQMLWLCSPIYVFGALVLTLALIKLYRNHRPDLRSQSEIVWGPGKKYPFNFRNPFKKLVQVPDKEFNRIGISWIIFCSFPMYTMMVSRSLMPYNCGVVMDEDGVTVSFLKENRNVRCDATLFAEVGGPTILFLIAWCVFPPIAAIVFIQHAKAKNWLKDNEFYQSFWPLYYPYKDNNASWISIQLLFVLMFHSTATIFKDDASQFTAGAIILLIEMSVIAWRRPWKEDFVAYIDLIAESSLIAFLIFGKDMTIYDLKKYDMIFMPLLVFTLAALAVLLLYSFFGSMLPESVRPKFIHTNNAIANISSSMLHEHIRDSNQDGDTGKPFLTSVRKEANRISKSHFGDEEEA